MKIPPLQETPSGGSMRRLVRLLLGEPRTVNMVALTSSDLGDKLLAASRKADLIQSPTPRRCMQCSREYYAPLVDAATACYALDNRPWWKRKLCRFFGNHPMLPDLPEWARDGIVVNVRINFSLRDRLMIALTGNASVRSWTACENPPGRVETTSHAMADRPGFLEA